MNKYLDNFETDWLFHFGLEFPRDKKLFDGVKFICTGGSAERMKVFATMASEILDLNSKVVNLAPEGRFVLYKVGPILAVNHGMGMGSTSIMLNEIFKLIYYCNLSNVKLIRMGTSGGLGVTPGSIVITKKAFNPLLKEEYCLVSCGQSKPLTPVSNERFNTLLQDAAEKCGYTALIGNTIATDDYYEGQARMDGAFCEYDADTRINYLKKAYDQFGVRNFEMESTLFLAFCNRANLEGAVVCVTYLNRLFGDRNNDQIPDEMDTFEKRPLLTVIKYISNQLCN